MFVCFSQQRIGSPFITNYNKKGTNTAVQTWGAVQDERGIMYFVNNKGLLEFDGQNWKLYELKNRIFARAINKDKNGRIFVAGNNEISYLSADSTGNLELISLLEKYKIKKHCGTFHSIIPTSENIYFLSKKGFSHYNYKTLKFIDIKLKPNFGFKHKNELFVFTEEKGLCTYKNNKLIVYDSSRFFTDKNNKLLSIPYSKNKVLINVQNDKLYLYDVASKKKTPFKTQADKYLLKNQVYRYTTINNKLIAFSTVYGGIVIINKKGELISIINENSGLSSNIILNLYTDNQQNLWACMQNGLAVIDVSNPITLFGKKNGINDYSISSIKFNNTLYTCTFNGLLYLPISNLNNENYKEKFNAVEGINAISWDVFTIDSTLFTIGSFGLAEIKNNKTIKIYDKGFLFKNYFYNKMFPKKLFLTHEKKVFVKEIIRGNGKIKLSEKKEIITANSYIYGLFLDKKGNVWVKEATNGVGFAKLLGKNKYKYKLFDENLGFLKKEYYNLQYIDNKAIVFTNNGTYEVINKNNRIKFVESNYYNKEIKSKTDIQNIYSIYKISENKLFIDGKNKAKQEGLLNLNDNSSLKWDNKMFVKTNEANICNVVDKNTFIINTKEGIVYCNFKFTKNYSTSYNSYIRKVTINNDSVIFNGTYSVAYGKDKKISAFQEKLFIPVLSYNENNIVFDFSAGFYEAENKLVYSYKLENYDKDWSAYAPETKKEYTNLREGQYMFLVKAKNLYDKESKITKYKFTVLPPWYRTYLAFFAYFLFFVFITWILIKFYTRRLVQAKIKLEKIISRRTKEIKNKNNLLRTKNEEILAQNEEINQQNEEIKTTNNQLDDYKNHLEDKIKEQTIDLIAAKENAEISNNLKTAFLQNLSHEIRTPLNAIIGFSDFLVEDKTISVENKEFIKKISNSGSNIVDIIESIIKASKIQVGDFEKEISLFKPEIVLNKLHEEFSSNENFIKKTELTLQYSIKNKELNKAISSDKNILTTILYNLIDNAIKFTEKGTVEFGIVKKDKKTMHFFVKDTGIGIKTQNIKFIFEKFRKIEEDKTKLYRGLGLGLTIAKSMVEHLKGEIWVESEINKGTTFYFTIPIL